VIRNVDEKEATDLHFPLLYGGCRRCLGNLWACRWIRRNLDYDPGSRGVATVVSAVSMIRGPQATGAPMCVSKISSNVIHNLKFLLIIFEKIFE
jgi:hypothetical protein